MSESVSPRKAGRAPLLATIAWYALVALPVAVPIIVAKVPFSSLPPLTNEYVVYPKLLAMSWLVGISLLAWGLGVLTGRIETRSVPLRWWLLGFFGLAALSTVFGLSPLTGFFGGRYWAAGLLVLLLGGGIFLLVTQLITSRRRAREMAWSTVAGGVVVALVGLLQVLGLNVLGGTVPAYVLARGGSLLSNPDFTGTYLVVPAVLAAALALSEEDRLWRSLGALSFMLTTVALVMTLTRGAWIAATVGLVLLGVAVVRSGARVRWSYVAATVGAALALPALMLLRDPTRVVRQLSDVASGASAGSGRLFLWQDAISIIQRYPLLGTGPDSYRYGWYGVRTVASVRADGLSSVSQDPHNLVLLLAATLGIPAAVVALGFVFESLRSSAGTVFVRDESGSRLSYAGWWAALAALVTALFFSTNTIPVVAALFAVTGMLAAARAKPLEWPRWATYVVTGAVMVLALAAIVISSLTIAADATLMHVGGSAPNKVAVEARAAQLAPWYADARERAAWDYAAGIQAKITSGDPQAAEDVTAAEQRLRAAIKLDPREFRNYIQLASFLNNTASVQGASALQRSIAAADSALAIYPLNAEAAYVKAAAQLGLGDAAAAVQTLSGLWDVDPRYPDAGLIYAEALFETGDQAQAKAVIDDLRKRFPNNADITAEATRIQSGKTGQ